MSSEYYDSLFALFILIVVGIPWAYGMWTFVVWAYQHLPFEVVWK